MAAAIPSLSLGNDTTICEGDSLILKTNILNGQYLWNTGSSSSSIVVKQAGKYWLKVTMPNASLSDTLNVSVNPKPKVDLGSDTILCDKSVKQLNAFNAGASYSWNNGDMNSSINVNKPGTYVVTVTLAGCIAKDSINIQYKYSPVFSLGKDTSLCKGQTITLDPKINANLLWQNGSTMTTFTITEGGVYKLTATNNCGSYTDELVVKEGSCELYIPSAFTPNHDGKNDVFKIISPHPAKKFELKIFNRWGTMVYYSIDPNKGWDGNSNGIMLSSDNYIWILSIVDANGNHKDYKGNVFLIR